MIRQAGWRGNPPLSKVTSFNNASFFSADRQLRSLPFSRKNPIHQADLFLNLARFPFVSNTGEAHHSPCVRNRLEMFDYASGHTRPPTPQKTCDAPCR